MHAPPEPQTTTGQDLDWRLLAPLIVHVALTHIVISVVRVSTSYRSVELELNVIWLGAISAAFAILPIFVALKVGRFIDRGYDVQAAWIGGTVTFAACVCLWLWPISAWHLLFFTIALGTGHMFLMASQQMLTLRSASARKRESAFGYFMVAMSIGQGLGPLIVGWVGRGTTVAPTRELFIIGVIAAALCLAFALVLRRRPRTAKRAEEAPLMPVLTLLRVPGLLPVLIASVVTVTASDLLIIYLPLLGAERHIDASHIGFLLVTKSVAALIARMFYARMIFAFGRKPLTLGSSLVAAGAFAMLLVPSLPAMYLAAAAVGLGLGIASTLTLSGVAEHSPSHARGTAMSLRITGNRMGLVLMPFVAGVVASGTGVLGIFVLCAFTLATCAVVLQWGPGPRGSPPPA
ncbi:MAG: MFS transporter [Hyphomicrobiales bacterium]|nr:MFS transporter [Hyphomicrobiales bacterium]